jgi:hypothetical protein
LNSGNKNLEVQKGAKGKCTISKLTEEVVTDELKAFEWLEIGESIRRVALTDFNKTSSRSHTIFRINLEMTVKEEFRTETIKRSEINLVDLAGSEGVTSEHNQARAAERANINKSLLALSMVVQSKAFINPTAYISYRKSKLTRILENALSGDSKTCIICTINQANKNKAESINTLKFGMNAKMIKTKVSINERVNKQTIDLESYKQLEEENIRQKQKIENMEEEIKNIIDGTKEVQDDDKVMNDIYTRQYLNYTQEKLIQKTAQVQRWERITLV